MKKFSWIVTIARIIIGLTFIFSGFVKAVDPIGSMIKFDEYFEAFNTVFLQQFSLFFSIALSSLEFILGFSLIFSSKIKLVSLLSLLLMAFFTIQTFILAIWNPVTDCGCFGDAIKLTNWQTFYKNLVLMILVLIVYLNREKILPVFPKREWLVIFTGTAIVLCISLYSWLYMPLIDFRPYKAGNDIKKLMSIPAGKHGDVYKSVLIYKNKKTGQITKFSEDNIPMDMETWEWLETKTQMVEKGFTPPIHDFKISDRDGIDLTDSFLTQKGYRILIVQEDLNKTNKKAQKKIIDLVEEMQKQHKIYIWALTSSVGEIIEEYVKKNSLPYTFLSADPTTLKTINRSNPAIILFKDNVVIKHWPARGIPGYQKLINGIQELK